MSLCERRWSRPRWRGAAAKRVPAGADPVRPPRHGLDPTPRELLSFGLAQWGCGAAGSAREWHSRGHGFDPRQLHQTQQQLAGTPLAAEGSAGQRRVSFLASPPKNLLEPPESRVRAPGSYPGSPTARLPGRSPADACPVRPVKPNEGPDRVRVGPSKPSKVPAQMPAGQYGLALRSPLGTSSS